MRIPRNFVLLLSVLLLVATAHGQDNTTVLGSAFTGRPYLISDDIVLEDHIAESVLRDVADALHPAWLADFNHDLGGFWRDLLVDGDVAVAIHAGFPSTGYEVISLADPGAVTSLGIHQGLACTSGWISGSTLVLSRTGDLIIVNLTVPTTPQVVAVKAMSTYADKRWFSELDGALYCIDRDNDLRGFDLATLTDPGNAGVVTSLGGSRIDALADGNGVLYTLLWDDLGGGDGAVVLATLAPLGLGQFTETNRVTLASGTDLSGIGLALDGDLLLVTLSNGTIRAFGLAVPTQPSPGYELTHPADHLALSASKILIYTDDTLSIYARSTYTNSPTLLIERQTLPRIEDLVGNGPVVWTQLYSTTNLLLPVDISNPWLPQLGEAFDTGVTGTVHFADDLLLAVGGQKFQLVDLSDASQPQLRGAWTAPDYGVTDLQMTKDAAAIGFWGDITFGIDLYDLSDVDEPRLAAVIEGEGSVRAMGSDLLIAGAEPLRIYDLQDIYRPEVVGEFSIEGDIWNVVITDRHAYIVARNNLNEDILSAVDLFDPAAPVVVWSEELPSAGGYEIHVNAHRLHVSGVSNLIYDISDPGTPSLVGSYEGSTLVAFDNEVVVTGGTFQCILDETFDLGSAPDTGLQTGAVLESVYPNPSNASAKIAFRLDQAEALTVSVYDLKGRLVTDLASEMFQPGQHILTWHGDDAAGRAMASAVYYVRVHGPSTDAIGKVTLLK